jgi:hypothetical protein
MARVIYECIRYDGLGLYMDVVDMMQLLLDPTNKSFECDMGLTPNCCLDGPKYMIV